MSYVIFWFKQTAMKITVIYMSTSHYKQSYHLFTSTNTSIYKIQEKKKGKRKAISALTLWNRNPFKDRLARKIVLANGPYTMELQRLGQSLYIYFSPTIMIFSVVERKPGTFSSNNGIPSVRFFFGLYWLKEREKKDRNSRCFKCH